MRRPLAAGTKGVPRALAAFALSSLLLAASAAPGAAAEMEILYDFRANDISTLYSSATVAMPAGFGGYMLQVSTGSSAVVRMTGTGAVYARRYIGYAGGLIGLPGDNLGNHTATANLNMGAHGVNFTDLTLQRAAANQLDLVSGNLNLISGDLYAGANTAISSGRVFYAAGAAGSAAAPAYSFSGDADTGIFAADANTLAFSAAGAEKARLASNWKFGVGTTAPQYALHVASAAGSTQDLVVISTGDSNVIRMTGDGRLIARKFYGDGAGITGSFWVGDNFGNHIATANLTMAGNLLINVASISATGIVTAGYFQINGTTVAALGGSTSFWFVTAGINACNIMYFNTALGYRADANCAGGGSYDLAVGAGTFGGSTGNSSTGIGFAVGRISGGAQSTCVGYRACDYMGNNNVCVGHNCLVRTGAGTSANAFIGAFNDLGFNTAGTGNTIAGAHAGYGTMGAVSGLSAAVGVETTTTTTGSNVQRITAVGYQAGAAYNYDSGLSNNIFIGFRAAYNNKNGQANLIIGNNLPTPATNTNNTVNIGDALFITSSKVGVNLSAPNALLEVAGSLGLYSRTKAQLMAITPAAAGQVYYCSDCNPKKLVVSTGTSAGNFAAGNGGAF